MIEEYATANGIVVALGLVNDLVVAPADVPSEALTELFAFDPESVADRPGGYVAEFTVLARQLHKAFAALDAGEVDAAAHLLNDLLTAAPAIPHLTKIDDRWSLHHHPHGAGLVEAWTSICAEALARLLGDGHQDRVHLCASATCRRAFVDTTRSATRRYCSERCQNREKATALRQRRAATQP